MSVRVIDPPELGPANPAYANITVVPVGGTSSLITIAGQVATTPSGDIPASLEDQTDLCFSKLRTCLTAAGADIRDLTRVVYYVVGKYYNYDGNASRNMLGDKIIAFMGGHKAASCLLIVEGLSVPEFKIEIEASAVVTK